MKIIKIGLLSLFVLVHFAGTLQAQPEKDIYPPQSRKIIFVIDKQVDSDDERYLYYEGEDNLPISNLPDTVYVSTHGAKNLLKTSKTQFPSLFFEESKIIMFDLVTARKMERYGGLDWAEFLKYGFENNKQLWVIGQNIHENFWITYFPLDLTTRHNLKVYKIVASGIWKRPNGKYHTKNIITTKIPSKAEIIKLILKGLEEVQ